MGLHFAGIGTPELALVGGKVQLSLTGLPEAHEEGLHLGRMALDLADLFAEKPVDAKPEPDKTPLVGCRASSLHLAVNKISLRPTQNDRVVQI